MMPRIVGAEARTAAAVNALAGLRVSDVMTPDPVIAPAAFSVAGFTGIAARCRQDVFPVAAAGAGRAFQERLFGHPVRELGLYPRPAARAVLEDGETGPLDG
jgi:hypothetical protein